MPFLVRLRDRAHQIDLRLFRRVARAESEALDQVLPRLTRAADNSRLWIALAAVLFLSRQQKPRRAALRGLLSIAASSALVNGPIKMIGRRTRPATDLVPAARRALKVPVTTSFPSGHTASAFAFATGCTLELRGLGTVLYPLACGVGLSRVYTGVHYPGDVLAGAAVGAGLARLTTKVWPVPPASGATAKRDPIPADLLPAPDGAGLTVVVNQTSGNGRSPTGRLRQLLPAAEIVEVDPSDGEALIPALQEAAADSLALGICGGDGSVNSAARIAIEQDVPLLVVPGGTLDHFATALGIGSASDAASALKDHRVLSVDLGVVADRLFLNTSSLGSYVELVEAREALEEKLGKWPALLIALGRVLRRSDPLDIEIDGKPKKIWLAFIGNCHYRPAGFGPSWRERLDDGHLDFRYVEADQPWARTRLVGALLTGRLGRSKVYSQSLVSRIELRRSDGSPLTLARDGEVFDAGTAVTVSKAQRQLRVFAPKT